MGGIDPAPFRALARGLTRLDLDVYAEAGRDPLEPVIGGGPSQARLGVFGRDPGRHEILHGMPFIGAGGQKVRQALWRAGPGGSLPYLEASIEIGRSVFWANMVPYKPVGNKIWSTADRKAFAPLVRDLLVDAWAGRDLLVLGREPFLWFGLADREVRARLNEHWGRDDRYESSVEVPVEATGGHRRVIRLHPLPHPSPLNARWAPEVPRLFDAALRRIGWSPERWSMDAGDGT